MLIVRYYVVYYVLFVFFFKQKTAYEMRISDWSSDVCSSDLFFHSYRSATEKDRDFVWDTEPTWLSNLKNTKVRHMGKHTREHRSEEHTSELQSLMRISYAVFCLKKKKKKNENTNEKII